MVIQQILTGSSRVRRLQSPNDIVLDLCPFWVQVNGLLMGMMSDRIETAIEESLGDVEAVDVGANNTAWGLWDPRKVREVTKLARRFNPNMLFLIETRKSTSEVELLRVKCNYDCCLAVDSKS